MSLSAGAASPLVLDSGIRSIRAELLDLAGDVVDSASDLEFAHNDDPYTRNLTAFMGGSGYLADVGMNMTGFFGIVAGSSRPGSLTPRVDVLESYTNDQSIPVDLMTSFIVVDGELDLVAREGSTLTYGLSVGTFGLFGLREFDGEGTLTGSPTFTSTFSTTGDSLGATQSGPGGIVSIPFSVHTLDLGRLEPGEEFVYTYSLSIVLDAPILEGGSWTFRDPSGNTSAPALYTVSATPADPGPGSSAVPLPASLGLLVLALAPLAGLRRRHS
jgi:hypothetical protein